MLIYFSTETRVERHTHTSAPSTGAFSLQLSWEIRHLNEQNAKGTLKIQFGWRKEPHQGMTWLCQKQAARNRKRGPAVAHLNPNEDASRNNNLPPAGLYGLLALPCPRLSDRLLRTAFHFKVQTTQRQGKFFSLLWCDAMVCAWGARLIDNWPLISMQKFKRSVPLWGIFGCNKFLKRDDTFRISDRLVSFWL